MSSIGGISSASAPIVAAAPRKTEAPPAKPPAQTAPVTTGTDADGDNDGDKLNVTV